MGFKIATESAAATNIQIHFAGDMRLVEEALEARAYGLTLPLPDPHDAVMVFDGGRFLEEARKTLPFAAAESWARRHELVSWLFGPAGELA